MGAAALWKGMCRVMMLLAAVAAGAVTVAGAAAAAGHQGEGAAAAAATTGGCKRYPSIFVFGDSLLDTGNGPLTGNTIFKRTRRYPYGRTFPGRPFNRFSDGRVIVDFLAMEFGLPFLNPSLDASKDFSNGANYATSGATVLNSTARIRNSIIPVSFKSLQVQLSWHLDLKAKYSSGSSGSGPDFDNGLYVMLLGGNDYIQASISVRSTDFIINRLTPLVISGIRAATEVLYANGARNFLFIGISRLGCLPSYVGTFVLVPMGEDGCLDSYNSVAYNHGAKLLMEVQSLRVAFPDAQFLYGDYYGAFTYMVNHKEAFGFKDVQNACCGVGKPAPDNFNVLAICNQNSTFICNNPNEYVNWDGFHFTDRFNFNLVKLFMDGSFLDPPNGLKACMPL